MISYLDIPIKVYVLDVCIYSDEYYLRSFLVSAVSWRTGQYQNCLAPQSRKK